MKLTNLLVSLGLSAYIIGKLTEPKTLAPEPVIPSVPKKEAYMLIMYSGSRNPGDGPPSDVKVVDKETWDAVKSYAWGTFFTGLYSCGALYKCHSVSAANRFVEENNFWVVDVLHTPSF